jgi:hypothetical protein
MKDLALLGWQSRDCLVERRPAFEVIISCGGPVHMVDEALAWRVAAGHDIRAVIGGVGRGTRVMPRKIEQFAVELCGRQGHQLAGRVDGQMPQGPVQPHGCVLEHVVGVIPAADVGKLGEHPMSQGPQSIRAQRDDLVAGRKVTRSEAVEAGGEGRIELVAVHAAAPGGGKHTHPQFTGQHGGTQIFLPLTAAVPVYMNTCTLPRGTVGGRGRAGGQKEWSDHPSWEPV